MMEPRIFFYGLWSLGIVGLFLAATTYAYSPFADGGRVSPRTGVYGPTHK
jgi:hypothetical protein